MSAVSVVACVCIAVGLVLLVLAERGRERLRDARRSLDDCGRERVGL